MVSDEPWLNNWNVESPLGKGGQGTTFVVSAKKDGQKGVLKVLKHQESDEARRRMYREVSNLKTLHVAGCKVPQIFDGNTEQFEAKDVPLFFVMEFIQGGRLCDFVQKAGGFSLEKSIAIALDLCSTVEKALNEDVIHRDLKPENMVVRDFEKNDIVIVDYGLSFNKKVDENLTGGSETLDNSFCSLSERRVPGGNRRDPRSEFTSVCAILYYCITGKPPVDLVGPDGRAPHRRSGSSIREKLGEKPETARAELLFDRGFAANIDVRFQTIQELVSNLQYALHPAGKLPVQNPNEIAKRVGELLLKNNRPVQIAAYTAAAKNFRTALNNELSNFGILNPFSLTTINSIQSTLSPEDWEVADTESLKISYLAQISIHASPLKILFAYQIRARGHQCGIFRSVFKRAVPPNNKTIPIINWEAILWYDGLVSPNLVPIVLDLKACVVDAMTLIEQDILSLPSKTVS